MTLTHKSWTLADWIRNRFHRPAKRLQINHHEIDFNEDGQIRRIVEDELRIDR